MKKAELKQGVAYLVISNENRIGGTWRTTSVCDIARRNSEHRKFIIFKDGEPLMGYRSNSTVLVTSCDTYGEDCQTHTGTAPNGLTRRCPKSEVRLMDIRDEFYPAIAKIAKKNRAERADDGRGEKYAEHLARKAKREQEAIAKPIRDEFYKTLNEVTGAYLTPYWSELSRLNHEQMKALLDLINAGRKVGA